MNNLLTSESAAVVAREGVAAAKAMRHVGLDDALDYLARRWAEAENNAPPAAPQIARTSRAERVRFSYD